MNICTRARRTRRALGTALAAVLMVVALGACNPDQLGAAAVIDGTVVSTDTLQSDTRAYLAAVPNADKSQVQQRILERIVLSRVIAKAARRAGVHVSVGTVADQRAQIFASTKNRAGLVKALATQQSPTIIPPSYVEQWIKDQLLFRKIVTKLAAGGDPQSQEAATKGSNTLIATGKSMKIEINPRYGSWNPDRGIESLVSGGLSSTAAELSAKK